MLERFRAWIMKLFGGNPSSGYGYQPEKTGPTSAPPNQSSSIKPPPSR